MIALIDRGDYWQTAYLVPKGADRELRAQPVVVLRESVGKLAPFLADRLDAIGSWDDVKTLEVRVDRLERWHRPGLLLIGDAAHAMSPVGGVGINLAVQDAVAAANRLAPLLLAQAAIPEAALAAIERRRLPPVRLIQALQLQIQKRVISRALASQDKPLVVPPLLKWLLSFRAVRNLPAWLIGYGWRREDVRVLSANVSSPPR